MAATGKSFMTKFTMFLFASCIIIFPTFAKIVDDKTFEEELRNYANYYPVWKYSLELNKDWSYTISSHRTTKIQKETAKSMGEIAIGYDRGREQIKSIKAFTTDPSGKKYRYSKIQDFSPVGSQVPQPPMFFMHFPVRWK